MWTRDSLGAFAAEALGGRKLVLVSNREPYMHFRDGSRIRWVKPAGGMVGALDPVLQATGGLWVAHGAGSGDRATVGAGDRLPVPPDQPRYALRRVWLTKAEEAGYYYGLANEALWPLCHVSYIRPEFRDGDWEAYQAVNRKFAAVVLDEVGTDPALVLVQDYHLALLPRLLRAARPDLAIAQFWHIPWPNVEIFRICPWRKELLEGMLGNDLIGFHIQYHCHRFLECVDAELQVRVDREHQVVHHGDRITYVRPFPIGTDAAAIAAEAATDAVRHEQERLRQHIAPTTTFLAVGVDRIDYTKGIPERFQAIDRFLIGNPNWRERFQYLGVGAPSRSHIQAYQDLDDRIQDLVEDINWRHGTETWQPIVWLHEHTGPTTLHALYGLGHACLVTSLHDGMNLVAKEYLAARTDGDGVLLLSRFTGASRDLPEAVLVNPYDIGGMARALAVAVEMPEAERRSRLARMREQVLERNAYAWAQRFIAAALKRADALESLVIS